MRGINRDILIGNATRNAELRHSKYWQVRLKHPSSHQPHIRGEDETQIHTIVC